MRLQAAGGARRLAACLILVPAFGLTQVPGVTVDNNPSAFPWQTGQLLVSWQAPSFTASTFTITAAPLNATFTFPSAAAMTTMGWVTVGASWCSTYRGSAATTVGAPELERCACPCYLLQTTGAATNTITPQPDGSLLFSFDGGALHPAVVLHVV